MANIPKRLDRKSLEAWLKSRPREDSIAIAHRAALRVFPLDDGVAESELAGELDFTTLPMLRCLIISGVPYKYFSHEIKVAASAARLAIGANLTNVAAHSIVSATSTTSLNTYPMNASSAAASSVAAVDSIAFGAAASIWKQITNDLECLARGGDPLQTPLWSDAPPDWFTAADTKTREIWAADEHPDNWAFWIKWWDAAIAGKPLNWDMQRHVALIDDDVWKAGPGEVAKAIAGIEEKFSLLDQIAELKKQLLPVLSLGDITSATARQRAHNHPPELIDATASLHHYVIVILKDLDEAEAELEKPEPSASVLTRIGQQLLDITARVISYCAVLSDVVLRKAAETIATTGTKWAVGIIAADLVLPVGSFKALADGLIEFAKAWLTKG